jgi:hypothetical protein
MFGHRMINVKYQVATQIRNQSIKLFLNYYESINLELSNWVFSSIRTSYLSILNFEDLKIDLVDHAQSTSTDDINTRYIKLETRVKGMMKGLIENVNSTKISSSILTFLNILITNYSYIPVQFFTLYELSRIHTENGELR